MHRTIRFPVIAALILAGASLATASGTLTIGSPAPALKVAKWVKGKPVAKFEKGKVYVVEFWATWCGPCKVSIPHLTDMAKKYKGKATFIGVSVWEEAAEKEAKTQAYYTKKVEDFVKEYGSKMDYNVAIDDMAAKDMSTNWMRAAEQGGIPSAFVVDQTGTIAWIGHPMADLDKVVGQVIDGTFDAKAEAARVAKEKEEYAARMAALKPATDAYRAKKYEEAVAEFDKAFAADPKWEMQYGMTKLMALFNYDAAGGNAYAKQLAEGIYKDNSNMLNSIAWSMVDDASTIKGQDYKIAVEIAQRGVDTAPDDMMRAYVLDTLAYAHFKAGDVAKAIANQEKALAAAAKVANFEAATLKEMNDRLALFKSKKG